MAGATNKMESEATNKIAPHPALKAKLKVNLKTESLVDTQTKLKTALKAARRE